MAQPIIAPRPRNHSIDIMKGLLVWGMILAHVIKFSADRQWQQVKIGEFIGDASSFAGFVFCFGYTARFAYLNAQPRYRQMLSTIIKLVLAYYFSGLMSLVLIENQPLTWPRFFDLILLQKLPMYCEFLISFAILLSIAMLARKPLRWLLQHPWLMLCLIGALLGATFFPYASVTSVPLSLLVGTNPPLAYPFPALQYSPIFLLGMLFAHQQWHSSWITWLLGTSGFAWLVWRALEQQPFNRFPPSWHWIVGGLAAALLWFSIASVLSRSTWLVQLFQPIGANTLVYLLLSNLIIFKAIPFNQPLGLATSICYTAVIIGLIWFVLSVSRPPQTIKT